MDNEEISKLERERASDIKDFINNELTKIREHVDKKNLDIYEAKFNSLQALSNSSEVKNGVNIIIEKLNNLHLDYVSRQQYVEDKQIQRKELDEMKADIRTSNNQDSLSQATIAELRATLKSAIKYWGVILGLLITFLEVLLRKS